MRYVKRLRQINPYDFVLKPGFFGICRDETVKWHFCRDLFHMDHASMFSDKRFFYTISVGQSVQSFRRFIHMLEDKLAVKHSGIEESDRPDTVFITPAEFWLGQSMRMSLFSIMLRAGLDYVSLIDDPWKIFSNYKYVVETKLAINRFFAGYTRYTESRRGWVGDFGRLKCSELESCICQDRRCGDYVEALLVEPWKNFAMRVCLAIKNKIVRKKEK